MFGDRRFLRVSLLSLFLFFPAACDSAEERLAKHYARGVELAEQGEPEKAILEFRNALQVNETHAPSLFGIAEALEAKGDLRAAVGHLQRVIELDPSHLQARVKLAQAMLLGGALEEARAHAEAAHALAPDDPDVLAVRAAVNLRLGDTEAALADAEAALAVDPDHAEAGLILIANQMAEGNTRRAMELIDRFLESNPEKLALNLVKLQLLEGDESRTEEFVSHLERVVELFPEERAFRVALARTYHRQGKDDAAVEAMRGLVSLDPENVDAVMQLIGFLREVEGDEAALRELEKRIASTEDPEQAFPYHRALVELELAAGDTEAAEARLDQLIAEHGLSAARIARARLHLAKEERAPARELVDQVLENDPKNVEALALKAAFEITDGNPDAAVLTIRTALNEAPDRPELLRLAATAHEQVGNIQIAGENLAAAVRASDYAPDHVLAYAQFLRQRDRGDAAATVLEEALRRNPENRELLTAAAETSLALGDWNTAKDMAARLKALGGEEGDVLAARIEAAALGGQGRLDETIDLLEGILPEAEEGRGAAFAQLVRSYIEADRVEEATAAVESALEENPENVTARILQGALFELTGDSEAAEASLRKAMETSPEAAAPRMALARLYIAKGDFDRARETLQTAIDAVSSPADHELRMALAGVQELQGDYEGAIETYRALIDERPDALVLVNNLVSLLSDHRSDDPESLQYAAQLARRLGDSPIPEFQDTYGWTLFLTGDHGGALGSLRKAVEELPGNPWVQFHIGQTYAALGENAKAREHLEKALQLGGEDFPPRAEIDETLQDLPKPESN